MNAKIKQNAFWIGTAAAGIALLAIFVLFVFTLYSERDATQGKITSLARSLKEGDVPGTPDIDNWKTYRKRLMDEYKTITEHYKACDSRLEKWFPGLPENPPRGSFTTRYDDEISRLEKAVTDKGTKLGIPTDDEEDTRKALFGFNWEKLTNDMFTMIPPVEHTQILKELQKRFWARERVANIITQGGVKVTRIHDFRFRRRLHDKIISGPWEGAPAGDFLIAYPGDADAASRGLFIEQDLPEQLGKTMSFAFTIELPFSEVPKFIQEFLKPSGDKTPKDQLLISITGLRVTIRDQHEPVVTFIYKQGDAEDQKKQQEEALKKIKPKDVMLLMSCQMIDFEPSKINTFQGKPAN